MSMLIIIGQLLVLSLYAFVDTSEVNKNSLKARTSRHCTTPGRNLCLTHNDSWIDKILGVCMHSLLVVPNLIPRQLQLRSQVTDKTNAIR